MKLEEMLHSLLLGEAKEDELIDSIANEVRSEDKANSLIQNAYKKMISFCFIDSAIKLSEKTGIKPVRDDNFKNIISNLYSRLAPKGEVYYMERIFAFTGIKPNFSKSEIDEICRDLNENGFESYSDRLRKLMEKPERNL